LPIDCKFFSDAFGTTYFCPRTPLPPPGGSKRGTFFKFFFYESIGNFFLMLLASFIFASGPPFPLQEAQKGEMDETFG
jgi:hypothetical protein